jgi:uncharacterized protein
MKIPIILPSAIAFLLMFSTACKRHPKPPGTLDQQLLKAVANKNNVLVQQLLHDGANIESKDANGNTPLILATENADIPMMKLLQQNDANVEAHDDGGETALVNAARGDDIEAVKTLLEKVSNVHDKEQALLIASENGADGILYLSSDANSRKPNPQQQVQEMPEVTIVRLLLDQNVNIETQEEDGETPLILAASYGQIEIVQLLLDRGAQVDARDNYGNTALIAAACSCAQATMRPTHDILNLLLDKDAKINAQANDGRTALMNAAGGFEADNVQLLIAHGANTHLKDKKGETALQLAVRGGRKKAIQLLQKR